MSDDEAKYEVTQLGNAVYYAFVEAYRKKHPELTEEQAIAALRDGKP
jgi:hypothetical protein